MNSLIFLSDLLAIFLLSSQGEFIERITYRGSKMEIELILFLQYLWLVLFFNKVKDPIYLVTPIVGQI